MARTSWIILAVILIGAGSAGLALTDRAPTLEEGAGAEYAVLLEGEEFGRLSIARVPDGPGLAPTGILREGQWYVAEWTVEGVVYVQETMHVAAEGIYRSGVTPVQPRVTVTVDGQVHEQITWQAERERFEAPSPLCGFIDPLGRAPGCQAPFTPQLGGWRSGQTTVWLDDAPWPARVQMDDGATWTYERVQHGHAVGATAPDVKGFDAPALGPIHDDGPRDTITAWPLQEAIKTAETDLLYGDLREWLAANPGAIVVEASFEARHRDGEYQDLWHITWSDGPSSFSLQAEQATKAAPAGLEAYQSVFDNMKETRFETLAANGVYPTPDQRPTTLPELDDAARAWQQLRGDAPANAFGFSLACDPACGSGTLWVGHVEVPRNRPDAVIVCTNCGMGSLDDVDTATFRHDGRLQGLDREKARFEVDGSMGAAPWTGAAAFASIVVGPASGVATAVGVAALLALLWKSLPLAGLFSRVHGDEALDNPARLRILELVEARPGMHHNAIVRATGKGNGSVEHHLRTLVRTGHLTQRRTDGFVCYYAKGGLDRRIMDALPVLKTGLARQILVAVQADPGLTGADLSRRTGAENSTVAYHLKRLEQAGLVERRRAGRTLETYPGPLAGQALRFAS